jgi:hypothetical protein
MSSTRGRCRRNRHRARAELISFSGAHAIERSQLSAIELSQLSAQKFEYVERFHAPRAIETISPMTPSRIATPPQISQASAWLRFVATPALTLFRPM